MRRTVASSKWPVFTCPLLAGFARPMTSNSIVTRGETGFFNPKNAVLAKFAKEPTRLL